MSTDTDTRTDEELAADPQAFDARLATKYEAWEKADAAVHALSDRIYRMAGYSQVLRGRSYVWPRPLSEALEDLGGISRRFAGQPKGTQAAELLERRNQAIGELARAGLAVKAMEKIYERPGNRWQRFFPCLNRDGHIHATLRDCPTVSWKTPMGWHPSLSGLTVEDAVQMPPKGLGPALCSVCFPLAPVEQRSMSLGQVADELTKGEREAAAVARMAVKAAKTLTTSEQFRTEGRYGETVTTVAKLKELVRKAIELEVETEYWAARSPEGWTAEQIARRQAGLADDLASAQRDAGRAASILRAREAEHTGWGADQAAITKMQQNKYKSARKEWGLS